MKYFAAAVAFLALSHLLAAQEVVQTQHGLAPGDGFGWSFVARELGGPNGAELVIGAPEDTSLAGGPGYVQVVAADGTILHLRLDGPAGSVAFGWDVDSAPDVDGDGQPDILAGDPYANGNGGRVTILSSASGAELLKIDGSADMKLGGVVADLGDVDGDGIGDFGTGAFAAAPMDPAVLVLSGALGAPVLTLTGSDNVAGALVGIGDVTGDGRPELAVGQSWNGVVRLWSGDGTLVREHIEEVPDSLFGWSLAGLGDVDADGFPDYAVGAPDFVAPGGGEYGALHAFSGATGAELWRADGDFVSENFGYRIAGGGDVDADGTPDAATASLANGHAFSGVDGARLLTYHANFGISVAQDVALVPDRNGDGLDEIALSGPTLVEISPGVWTGGKQKVETIAPVPVDCDGSGEFDFIEFAQGIAPDCNGNYVPDPCDIASGASLDINSDGIPDECQITFFGSPGTISVATGGVYGMQIFAKAPAAGKAYFIAGSLSGYLPGMTLAGLFVPLNPDAWFFYTVNHPNHGPLISTAGTLGLTGATTVPRLVVPAGLGPAWIGATFHHAYALIDGATVEKFSNAIALTLVP